MASQVTLLQAGWLSVGLMLSTLADRVLQFYLLSMIVLSGPQGEGLGLCTLALLAPDIAGSLFSIPVLSFLPASRALFGSAILSAVLSVSLPFILGLPSSGSESVLAIAFGITALCAVRAVGRVTLAPRLSGPMPLQTINAANWGGTIFASVAALYFMGTADVELMGRQLTHGAAMLYLVSAPLFLFAGRGIAAAETVKGTDLFKYMRLHKWSRSGLLSISILTFASVVAYGSLGTLAMESFQSLSSPLLLLVGSLCLGMLFGSVAAAVIVPKFKHRPTLIALGLSITALGVFLLSPISMSGARSLLIILGAVAATALITLDTVLQRIVPARLITTAAALRNAFTTCLLIPATIYCERLAPVTSAPALVRVLAAIALIASLLSLVPIGWRRILRAKMSAKR